MEKFEYKVVTYDTKDDLIPVLFVSRRRLSLLRFHYL